MSLNYMRNGDMIEIIVRDPTGAKIETIKCHQGNKRRYSEILKYLKDKYGFEPEIDIDKSINAKSEEIDRWD